MSIIQPIELDPADALAFIGLVLVGIGAALTWSIAVALLVLGVVLLLAILIGALRRGNIVHQSADELREINLIKDIRR